MADDDDPGQTHLKNAMSEGQTMAVPAGRGISGVGSKDKAGNKSASYQVPDEYKNPPGREQDYQDEWEPAGFTAGGRRVNRGKKGDRQ